MKTKFPQIKTSYTTKSSFSRTHSSQFINSKDSRTLFGPALRLKQDKFLSELYQAKMISQNEQIIEEQLNEEEKRAVRHYQTRKKHKMENMKTIADSEQYSYLKNIPTEIVQNYQLKLVMNDKDKIKKQIGPML